MKFLVSVFRLFLMECFKFENAAKLDSKIFGQLMNLMFKMQYTFPCCALGHTQSILLWHYTNFRWDSKNRNKLLKLRSRNSVEGLFMSLQVRNLRTINLNISWIEMKATASKEFVKSFEAVSQGELTEKNTTL